LNEKLNVLIENASLDIFEFDVHSYPPRTTMNVTGRTTSYYIMSYIKQGLAHVRFRNKIYVTEPGTVAILPPGEPHDHVRISDDPAMFLWWHFNFKIANTVDVLKLVNLPLIFRLSNSGDFEKVFHEYMELTRKPVSISNMIMRKAKSLEVMAFLMESAQTGNSLYNSKGVPESFSRILLEIAQNPGENCNLGALAEKYHMHPTYISNRFKDYFGISPVKFHRGVVMEKAKSLLRSDGMTVSQVAAALSFNDLSTFTRFFTTHTGIPPTKFKNPN
jgi:AraC family transcriptional regulator, arabinose operon regulatory protein